MDRTTVINRACIKLGVPTIASEDDQSEQARKAKLIFDSLAQAELRKQAWSFAIQRVILAYNTAAPVFGYRYAYDNPTDCLRIVTIGDYYLFNYGRAATTDDSPYLPEGKKVLTDQAGPLKIRYVKDLSLTPSLWDPLFAEAFACSLAVELTYTLNKVAGKRNDMKADYKEAIRDARRCNAIEQPPQNYAEEGYILSRFA
jgi:hypothetical protein